MRKMKYGADLMLQRQMTFAKFKANNGISFSGAEMYNAALDPNGKYTWEKGGQQRTGTGADLLDSRLAEITAKTSKNIDYVVLDRKAILDPAKRRRLVDKLFGYSAASKSLYDLGGSLYLPDSQKVQQFLDALRKPVDKGGLGLDLKEDDLNTATPIIINQDKGTKEAIKMVRLIMTSSYLNSRS
jgi:hypothetical protein